MTREEAIKSALKYLVSKQQEQGSWGYADNDDINEVSWNEIIEWIDTHNTAIKVLEHRWISVSERLPEDMQRVLIWFEYYRYGDFNCMYQTYGFGYVYDGKWSPSINGETGWKDARIIAWMPLPEPYNAESEEKK